MKYLIKNNQIIKQYSSIPSEFTRDNGEGFWGGYDTRTDLHYEDGWRDDIIPKINTMYEELGSPYYDSISDKVLYNINQKSIENIKQIILLKIDTYDKSLNINSFLVNNSSYWLTPSERTNYKSSIESAKLLNETEIMFPLGNNVYRLPISSVELIIAQIQRYADACYIQTMIHKQTIMSLSTINEIKTYDYTYGYPPKLNYTL